MTEDIKKEEQGGEPADELSKCQKERDEYLEGWKRAKADLLNYKKDEGKRFETVVRFANETIVKDIIGVLDSFDLALATLETPKESPVGDPTGQASRKAAKGMYLIKAQLEDILKQHGLERVIVSVDKQFDPSLQEAIASVESDKPSGTVIEEVESGYILNGKLIRPARVKVSK